MIAESLFSILQVTYLIVKLKQMKVLYELRYSHQYKNFLRKNRKANKRKVKTNMTSCPYLSCLFLFRRGREGCCF